MTPAAIAERRELLILLERALNGLPFGTRRRDAADAIYELYHRAVGRA